MTDFNVGDQVHLVGLVIRDGNLMVKAGGTQFPLGGPAALPWEKVPDYILIPSSSGDVLYYCPSEDDFTDQPDGMDSSGWSECNPDCAHSPVYIEKPRHKHEFRTNKHNQITCIGCNGQWNPIF